MWLRVMVDLGWKPRKRQGGGFPGVRTGVRGRNMPHILHKAGVKGKCRRGLAPLLS